MGPWEEVGELCVRVEGIFHCKYRLCRMGLKYAYLPALVGTFFQILNSPKYFGPYTQMVYYKGVKNIL